MNAGMPQEGKSVARSQIFQLFAGDLNLAPVFASKSCLSESNRVGLHWQAGLDSTKTRVDGTPQEMSGYRTGPAGCIQL
jgi:hypothetical protein